MSSLNNWTLSGLYWSSLVVAGRVSDVAGAPNRATLTVSGRWGARLILGCVGFRVRLYLRGFRVEGLWSRVEGFGV